MKKIALIALLLGVIIVPVSFAAQSVDIQVEDQRVRLDVSNPGASGCPVVILIHGSAGLEGDRADRYSNFSKELMNIGIAAITVHYFDSQEKNWIETITKTVDYACTIPNANKNKIGLVGYSLGGTLALQAALADKRVALLVVNSGDLPAGFTKEDAGRLPFTYMLAGTEDSAIVALRQLKTWFDEYNKPFETRINNGGGHTVSEATFKEEWRSIVIFLRDNFKKIE